VSSQGNKYFQDNAPWKLIKEDKAKAHQVVSNCVNLVKDVALLLKPIMPRFAADIEKQLNVGELDHEALGKNLGKHRLGEAKIVLTNIEKLELPKAKDPFTDVDLRVAQIKSCKNHPNADKLVVLELDAGNGESRTICAGIRAHYTDEQLTGKKIVIVYNLKPATLRGVESRGMLLAASDSKGVFVVSPEKSSPGELVSVDGVPREPKKEISIDEFRLAPLSAEAGGRVMYAGKQLKTEKEQLYAPGVTEKCEIH
jgi:methionyl-tRNA synthetase